MKYRPCQGVDVDEYTGILLVLRLSINKTRSKVWPMDPPPVNDPQTTTVPQLVLPAPKAGPEPRWDAELLLMGNKEAIITLGESIYRLRLTRNGKLILYK